MMFLDSTGQLTTPACVTDGLNQGEPLTISMIHIRKFQTPFRAIISGLTKEKLANQLVKDGLESA